MKIEEEARYCRNLAKGARNIIDSIRNVNGDTKHKEMAIQSLNDIILLANDAAEHVSKMVK